MKKRYMIIMLILLVSSILFLTRCESPQLKGAMIYIQQSQWDKAKNLLLEAVDVNPKDGKAHYWLGRCYGQDGEYIKMNQHFEEAKKVTPNFNKDIEDARTHFYQQHYNRGINSINSAVNRQGEDRERLINQAIEELKIALMIREDDVNATVALGMAYLQVRNREEALKYLNKTIELDPNNTRALTNLGLYYSEQAKIDENNELYRKAVEYFEKVLEVDPGNINVLQRLAFSYDELGETEKAIQAYDEAIEAFPDNADLYFNKAASLYRMDRKDEAIELFNRVIEMNPEDEDALLNIGQIYTELENFEEARPVLEKVIELNPENKTAWEFLVMVYTRLGNMEEANKALEKVKTLQDK